MDAFRGTLWNIAKGVLWFLDGFFDVLNKMWQYKFFDNEYVNKVFSGALIVACAWLIIKVMIELIMNHIIKNDGRDSPLTIFRGVVLAITMMFLISPLFTFGYQVSNALNNAVISVSGMNSNNSQNEGTISKAIITSMVYDDQMEKEDRDYLIEHWKTVDINQKEGGIVGLGDVYTYSVDFFMLVVLSVLTVFLLFFIAIQIAKRVMEIALFKIIAPFCCTSLTSNNPQAFQTWCKSTMGLFLITVVQFVSLGLMLNMFGSAIDENGTMAGIFLIVGALLFIISTPTLISSLLGQQSGLMTAFGDMQSIMAMGQGIKTGFNVAGYGVLSAGNKLASGVSVIPKAVGYMSGVKTQFNNYKAGADGNMVAFGKTAFSEIRKPFASAYNHMRDSYQEHKKSGFRNGSTPFKADNSNPYSNPHSVQFNPIRQQYQDSSGNELNNRRWY